MTISFETGVPIPEGTGKGKTAVSAAIYQLAASPVGASFYAPLSEFKNAIYARQSMFSAAAKALGRGNYVMRQDAGGVRVWKTAEKGASA